MTVRYAVTIGACAVVAGIFGSASQALAQAPFTIHRPPDGTIVREKVRIEIPRASIGAGGFISFFLDDKFQVAVSPDAPGSGDNTWFTYVWDTKSAGAADGEHTIRAVLYEPAADSASASAVTEKGRSEVKVTVANLITNGPRSLALEYKYIEGQNLEYARTSKSQVQGGLNDDGTTRADKDLAQTKSKLVLDIQDVRKDPDLDAKIALVRNKLESLSILTADGRDVTLDPSQLSSSMYQELLTDGSVHYETGAAASLTEFSAKGLPIDHTLELPLLPSGQVSPGPDGREWKTENQRLDIPGLSSTEQPQVTLTNKLVDLEWEHNRETAKIHQHYDGTIDHPVKFGNIRVSSPHITYDRDVYFAYNSGTLIKTVRTLTIEGRTRANVGQVPAPVNNLAYSGSTPMQSGYSAGNQAGGGTLMDRVRAQKARQSQPASGYPGSSGSGYPSGYPGSGGSGYSSGSSGSGYPSGYPGSGGSGYPSGYSGSSGSGYPSGYPGSGGSGYSGSSGSGYPSGYPGSGGSGYSGMMSGGYSGMSSMGSGSGPNGYMALPPEHPVTVKSVTTTDLSGTARADNTPVNPFILDRPVTHHRATLHRKARRHK